MRKKYSHLDQKLATLKLTTEKAVKDFIESYKIFDMPELYEKLSLKERLELLERYLKKETLFYGVMSCPHCGKLVYETEHNRRS